ncbi:c-type cytochrome [Vibrio sinaloensis]|uniref:Cytochrome C554 n=1 Tax=Photobacterium sp. (strain ATCC 43367) TaxID=379097 RepID=A0A0A5JHY8_PHOS4|nr:cytochrome c [Vibrio sinaloensis]KGY07553.1 cytochrome C554 [Vibrio sinaloensis]
MKPILTLFALLFASHLHATQFGDAELGKIKSPSCVFCHGATGVAVNKSYPNLNGQNAQYLFQSMLDYKSGNRSGPLAEMMAAQLSRLNEQDLKDIAAYYAQQNTQAH